MLTSNFKSRQYKIMSGVRRLVTWKKKGHTAVVTLQADDNRMTPAFLSSFNTVLDAVENDDTIRALVTIGEGKFYSNGLAVSLYSKLSVEEIVQINKKVTALLRRLLTFPMVTVAAINGHAFGAGALLSLAHDYRVMCTGRGWFCFPEIKIKLLFTKDFLQLAKAKLPPDQYVSCLQYGKKYTAEEAKRVGIIQECSESDKVLETAVELADDVVSWQEEEYDRGLLAKMKEDIYHDTIKAFVDEAGKYYSKL